MPNHCNNVLHIEGSAEDINKWTNLHITTHKDNQVNLDFNASVPMPEELQSTTSPVRLEGPNKNMEPEQSEQYKKDFGHDNWYDWANDNWGTKWNAYETQVDPHNYNAGQAKRERMPYEKNTELLTVHYTTAWCPPHQWLHTMSEQFPALSFTNYYSIEGEEPCIYIEATK